MNNNVEDKYKNMEAERQPRSAIKQEAGSSDARTSAAGTKKEGRRGKRKADVVRPGPLYQIIDAIITIAGLALVGAVILYIIMIFG